MVTCSVSCDFRFFFVGDPRKCRVDVAFRPSFVPQPSGAIEETGTTYESTVCCVVHHDDPWRRFLLLVLSHLLRTPENAGVT